MARCLVTGGAGFIGSHVVDALIEAGHKVAVLDNFSTGSFANIHPDAEIFKGDIRESLALIPEVDYVFHLAALARIQPSIEDPVQAHSVNLTGTLNILDYCRKTGAKFIFSSSSSIYAGEDLPTSENAPTDAKNPYTLQKMSSEAYTKLYAELYNLDYTILRYFNVYGERQILGGAYAAVVGIFLDQRAKGQPLTITWDGEQRRDFTYVKDVAQANLQAMNWPRNVFNIGTGKNYSMNEIADFVGGEKQYIGDRQGEVRETLADPSRAFKEGWKPETDIEDWIAQCKS